MGSFITPDNDLSKLKNVFEHEELNAFLPDICIDFCANKRYLYAVVNYR